MGSGRPGFLAHAAAVVGVAVYGERVSGTARIGRRTAVRGRTPV